MKPIFTEKESVVVVFLVATFLIGTIVTEAREYFHDRDLDHDIPAMREEIAVFKTKAAEIVSIQERRTRESERGIVLDEKRALVSIDVNRASKLGLERLPGIGPVLADRIVNNRDSLGFFEQIEDLERVKGIGRKKLEKLAPYVLIGSPVKSGKIKGNN